jgi:nicotinamidase-related amidase
MKEGEVHTESSEECRYFVSASNETWFFLTIDMQRDFSLPSSAAYIPGTNEAIPSIRTLVDAFRSANRPIVHVIRLYLTDGSNADLPRRAQLAARNRLVCPGTPGAELVDELNPDPGVKQDAELLSLELPDRGFAASRQRL